MGKAAKKRRSDDRRRRKRAIKAERREAYKALADQKRQRVKSVIPGGFNHATMNCGNPGCKRCHPRTT